MKLAIAKIGANITFSRGNASAANADIMYFLRQLEVEDHDITFHTGITRNTMIPKRVGDVVDIKETEDFNGYDRVLVFNGAINFFGGACDYNLLSLYKALRRTDSTPIVYVHTDGNMPFRQLWPLIHKRPWAQQMFEELVEIDPEKVFYLTQGCNERKMEKMLLSKPENINPARVVFYPLASTIMAKHEQFFRKNPIPFEVRPYDLMFGGATRNTHKRKKIEKFYSREDLNTCMFGNLRGVTVPHKINGKVAYQQVVPKYFNSKATVIIGDQFYENNFVTLRYYESLLADNIIFIDEELDLDHRMDGFHIRSPDEIHISPAKYLEWTDKRKEWLMGWDENEMRLRLVGALEDCSW